MNSNPEKPIISVIVPVYKVENRLHYCIESILGQSFKNFELLLIDDGSPDHSGEICDEYARKDKRIRVFYQQNAGVSAARNKGLDEAEGKYILFIDSDDYVEPGYLEHLYVASSPMASVGIGLSISGISWVTENKMVKKVVKYKKRTLVSESISCLLESDDMNEMRNTFSKLFEKKLLNEKKIRFDARVHYGEDTIFVFEYLLWCDYVVVIDNVDYTYWESAGSLSKTVNSFGSEYTGFCLYNQSLQKLVEKYRTDLQKMGNTYLFSLIFFQRALKTDYYWQTKSMKKRVGHLQLLLSENYDFVKKQYMPAYIIDKIGRILLLQRCVLLYDLFYFFLFRLKVKSLFMPKP